ncbi:MAG TPA: hypothetical protein DDW52_29730 [Planctomycetaceae bacterium]|nr:hypothetical protein [Planctomycetaceae bacterium]
MQLRRSVSTTRGLIKRAQQLSQSQPILMNFSYLATGMVNEGSVLRVIVGCAANWDIKLTTSESSRRRLQIERPRNPVKCGDLAFL